MQRCCSTFIVCFGFLFIVEKLLKANTDTDKQEWNDIGCFSLDKLENYLKMNNSVVGAESAS